MSGLIDLTGVRFGRLVVTGRGDTKRYPSGGIQVAWSCRCDCGNEHMALGGSLRKGDTQSCGCYNDERRRAANTTHGMSDTPEYKAYHAAKERCVNPRVKRYDRYGGRGIEFRFSSFDEFWRELGPRPAAGMSLDRIDNNGHYESGNVRWATQRQQLSNKSHCPSCTCLVLV